jgi:hypothetical protein
VPNPAITGKLIKLVRNPSFKNPRIMRITPVSKARAIAAPRYSGVPWAAIGATAARVMRLVTATGPTEREREVPKIAYNISGAMDAYKPTSGGSPASCA